ncbi:MAG TPA: DNA repair exonuclease [Alicycliphilus sp.]|nr:DNA repair exonuclease [Alicycliphilus sp.]
MKFIHAADIHLDSPLVGLSAYPDAPAEHLRTATRQALERLVDGAIEEQVDFMVIAGDLYDGDWKDYSTGLFFVRQMGRLRQAGIAVYLLYGNHDAESEVTLSLQLPDNVQVFSARGAQTIQLDALRVALHGQSFKRAATTDNLVPGYPAPVPGWFNIGVLHTALEGNAQHANYAPCSRAELQAKGYQYWALGHVHSHALEQGDVTIAYPGNLQGRHIRETGAHGALLVSVHDGQVADVQRLEVDVLRWHQLDIDCSQQADLPGALRLVGQALEQLLAAEPAHMVLAVRVRLVGATAAHAALLSDAERLRHEVIAQAVALDAERLWIEKAIVDTQAQASAGAMADDEFSSTLAQLQNLARGAAQDPDFMQELQASWQGMLDKLPHEVLTQAPELAALRKQPEQALGEHMHAALELLLARINAGNAQTY